MVMRGSQNGAVIVPGSLEKSLLWKKVSTREMPLKLFKLKLSKAEIETIRLWIVAGAPSMKSTKLPAEVRAQFARFKKQVQPILNKRCVSCHGADDPEAGLDLRSLASLVRGSNKGPVIVEGFAEKSILIRNVTSKVMPPKDSGKPLTAAEIRTVTRWIDKGKFADFVDVRPRGGKKPAALKSTAITEKQRQFWAFRKPVAKSPPNVKATHRIRTPIDRFVLAKLESRGLTFSPDASKRTLLRRAFFDLTGLPPTPEQARVFLEDQSPDAYERLIDRLLASPHYGERWGRHWLDVVGYVDTAGKDFNPNVATLSPGYWRYRDYVIAATNKDTPWNRFLIEQIAGDELVDWRKAKTFTPGIRELLTATGFLRNMLDATDEDISNLPFDRYEALFKLMERVGSSTLGMTLNCARCHSHKFDPIPQTDYYRFLSVFTAAYNPNNWLPPKRRFLYNVSQAEQAEIARRKTEAGKTLNKLKQRLTAIRQQYKDRLFETKLRKVSAAIRGRVKAAVSTAAKKRTKTQRELVRRYGKKLAIGDAELRASLDEAERKTCDGLRSQIRAAEGRLKSMRLDKLQVLWDVGPAPTIRLLQRGDVDFAGPKVKPGFLTILSPPGHSMAVPSKNAVGETTGLRLAFAEWLTRPEHPLTARVIVNRLWQHHFGRGIVGTPDNFGAGGSRPTHPALLDWLAVEFQRSGWSAKQFHKLVMTSTVYRQSSSRERKTRSATSQSLDPDNRLLWRMNLRRLDAEALRDSVLAVSGRANHTMGGPPVMLKATPSGLQTLVEPGKRNAAARRSVYLLARRANPLTFLNVFDYPIIDVNCTRRSASATPLQSLTMINGTFLTVSAGHLARRINLITGPTAVLSQKVATAYRLTLSRRPTPAEINAAVAHINRLEQLYVASGVVRANASRRAFENFAHMLMCSNEFLYVD
ncbi:MAG: DUF1553 domain-containing protein [Planctomycetaceae bacterium]